MNDFPIWQHGTRSSFLTLEGTVEADVAIIGGGLTGVTCAMMLSSLGKRVVLLEKDELGSGSSKASTGKVTAHQPDVLRTIQRAVSNEAAAVYTRLLLESIAGVCHVVEQLHLPCSLAMNDVYLYARQRNQVSALTHLTRSEQQSGLVLEESEDAPCPFPVVASSRLPAQPLLMPLPYLMGLARAAEQHEAQVYEHSRVLRFERGKIFTGQGMVSADTVILATGSPMGLKSLPILGLMEQHVLELRVLQGPPVSATQIDVLPDGLYLRPLPNGVIATYDLGLTGDDHGKRTRMLDSLLLRLLPGYRTTYRLVSQDVFSVDGLPLIGPVHPGDNSLLMATAYSGWGVTGSFLAARLLTGIILGKPLQETPLFHPHRVYPGHTRQILRGSVRPMTAYAAGILHPTAPACPHMGCRLRYSRQAQQWECPCHGSCFSGEGHVLHTPAASPAPVSPRPN